MFQQPLLSRRRLFGSMFGFVVVAHPLSKRLLAAVELQPLIAQVRRLVDAMEYLGEPFSAWDLDRINAAAGMTDDTRALDEFQKILDPYCLVSVRINPESRISVERAAAPARLVEHGWRAYLLKVRNEAGVTGALSMESPQARPVYRRGTGLAMAPQSIRPADVTDRWLELDTYGQKPMESQLSGLELEYRIGLFYSRDRGRREAQIGATLGAGTEDIGFRNRTAVLFDIAPSREVMLHVRDENGRPCMASFVVKDKVGRVYPARSKRLAPDFFFHEQI